MSLELTISKDELEKALAEIKEAEDAGFMYCTPVFRIFEAGYIGKTKAKWEGMLTKAHPTNGSFNWGRSTLYKQYDFRDGKTQPKNEITVKNIDEDDPNHPDHEAQKGIPQR